jgi:hypothetical protein
LGYPALLILLECFAINICAADISLKVISLQLKGTPQQSGSSMWLGFCFTVTPTMDGKPALSHPPPSQNGWLINIIAVQHVWRTVKEAGFKCPQVFLSNVPT